MRSKLLETPFLALAALALSACVPDVDDEAEDDVGSDAGTEDARVGDQDDAARDAASPALAVPDTWRRASGECTISLQGPDLVATAGDSTEYCVATFADGDCTYRVEYGDFPDPFAHAEADLFSREDIRIEADAAQLVTALYRLNSDAYLVGLRVASFAHDPPEYALNATARCRSPEALETARIVLQTVYVPHVGRGLCAPVRPNKCALASVRSGPPLE